MLLSKRKMKMKKVFNLFIIGFLVVFSSCKKYLELEPYQQLSDTKAITDASSARAAILGTYDKVQNYYVLNYPVLGYLPGDNVVFNGTLNQYLQLDQNALTPDNVIITDTWTQIYQAINAANSVIVAVPSLSDPALSATEKNTITGEAYFIRALGYFDLARGWGGVPLQLKPTASLSDLKGTKRSTIQQTYDQVQADLTQAETLLPDGTTRNRAVKNTAKALRARLHLYREQWSNAETYATGIISNGNYGLVNPYKTFFTAPFLTRESIFELTYSVSDANNQWNNWFPSQLGGQFTLQPSSSLISLVNNPTVGGGRNALISTITIGTTTTTYGNLYYRSAQRDDPAYVIRVAELYLIRAEARAQQGKLKEALEDLDAIRMRAGLQKSSAVTKDEVLLAIENERRIEFAFEAHRWFDLARTKRTGAVLGISDPNKWLFPIPFNDVAADPDLQQNPGY
jgi:hypothetical protein